MTAFKEMSPGSVSCSAAPTRFSKIAAGASSATRHWRPASPTTRSPRPASRISPGRSSGSRTFRPEDLFVLLHNIRIVFALGDPAKYLIDDEGIKQFMSHCGSTLGADFYLTPRDAVKAFVGLLSVIEQNPGTGWKSLLSQTVIDRRSIPKPALPIRTKNTPAGPKLSKPDDDLASFTILRCKTTWHRPIRPECVQSPAPVACRKHSTGCAGRSSARSRWMRSMRSSTARAT